MTEREVAQLSLYELPSFKLTPLPFDIYKSAVVAVVRSHFGAKMELDGYGYTLDPLRFCEPSTASSEKFSRDYSRNAIKNLIDGNFNENNARDDFEFALENADLQDKDTRNSISWVLFHAVQRGHRLGPKAAEFVRLAARGELPSLSNRRPENLQRDKAIVRLMRTLKDDIELSVYRHPTRDETRTNIYAAEVVSAAFEELGNIITPDSIAGIWYKKKNKFR